MYILSAIQIYLIIILFITFIFGVKNKQFYKLIKNFKFAISLPGASTFLTFVDSLQIAYNYKELLNYIDAITNKYGNLTRLIYGTNVFIVVAKPDDYKLVLTNVNGNNKSSVTKTWEVLIGDGIIRTDSTHRLRRKTIHPLLNLKYLSEYITFFDNYSNLCADDLKENVDGPMFDFKPYIKQYSLNVFLATTVGIQGMAHKSERDEILYWQEKLIKITNDGGPKPWVGSNWISFLKSRKQLYIAQEIVLNFIYSILPQKTTSHIGLQYNNDYNKTIFQKSKFIFNNYWEQIRNNFVSKSCEVSDENFLDDFRSFFFAIQNTITEITSFTMLMLSMHIDAQEKLRQEISDTFNDDKVDIQRLLSMQYFRMVFQETLRLFPLSPIILRQLTGDIKLDSCTLPDGCNILIPVFTIHRNPAYWHKPLEFIPERFSSESSSNRPRYTYIPFGTGLRDCLGQRYAFLSVATIIVNLVRQYRFVTTGSIDDVKTTFDIMLRVQDAKMFMTRV